ncbi:Rho GTPase-activating protein 2 [Stylosanthes scabra]|uniref:Rho GTPase-activating protein 2 n=1 Tax=Stylosanthes scabra TaxID=79078 RepID=A0ABU6ZEC3_9FABA|nr:Rho GTPase-activating protein 2 [Stylosanthes scabra]
MPGLVMVTRGGGCGGGGGGRGKRARAAEEEEEQRQLSLVALLVAALRKSMVACRVDRPSEEVISTVHHSNQMEIGWPTDVQHITHVTFDRFNGFLGLPLEFQVEIPARVPSASVSVFGVSAESMQCSYDSKGNSVPTILLLMQDRLYSQGGLKAEGIFRINPENSQEEHVRDQLNRGIVPENIDVHCLAGLIKAWFRELPSGILDGLSPKQVLQCNTEEESVELVKQLKPTESALLSWAIDLMADVVEEEECNKMNARNIAMVFAPNMTQMSDPLTALMHAVQVMNLLKTLIMKSLREREVTATGYSPMSSRSSNRQSEEEYDSQREMDTSGELRGTNPGYDDHHPHYSNSSDGEEEGEAESLSEIEECFLKQLDDDNTKGFSKQEPSGYLQEYINPISCYSGFSIESIASIADGTGNSSLSSIDGERLRTKVAAVNSNIEKSSPSIECTGTNDTKMIDKFTDSALPFLASI